MTDEQMRKLAEWSSEAKEAIEKAKHDDRCASFINDSSGFYWRKCNCNLKPFMKTLDSYPDSQ